MCDITVLNVVDYEKTPVSYGTIGNKGLFIPHHADSHHKIMISFQYHHIYLVFCTVT